MGIYKWRGPVKLNIMLPKTPESLWQTDCTYVMITTQDNRPSLPWQTRGTVILLLSENHLHVEPGVVPHSFNFPTSSLVREGSHDFCSDSLPGTRAVFLPLQIEGDSLEVFPQGQKAVLIHHGPPFHTHLLHQTGFQVIQMLIKPSAEFVQEGLVPSSKGALYSEEVVGLPYLVAL